MSEQGRRPLAVTISAAFGAGVVLMVFAGVAYASAFMADRATRNSPTTQVLTTLFLTSPLWIAALLLLLSLRGLLRGNLGSLQLARGSVSLLSLVPLAVVGRAVTMAMEDEGALMVWLFAVGAVAILGIEFGLLRHKTVSGYCGMTKT